MNSIIKDRYVLFSLATVLTVAFVCTVSSFNAEGIDGNGLTELEGMISDPSASQNGTVFKLTDLNGNEQRCFYGAGMPSAPSLCKLTGSFSSDGTMFFADRIVVIER
ncbi:MAG: hypothetical protein LBV13_00530 [Methanomassiliicoccaceae archaeon]|jgi:hypothetical protein|nr:hypothetical protein [Methanomassiliicoccaceae archaeon]